MDRLGYPLCKIQNLMILSLVEQNQKPHDSFFGGNDPWENQCWKILKVERRIATWNIFFVLEDPGRTLLFFEIFRIDRDWAERHL